MPSPISNSLTKIPPVLKTAAKLTAQEAKGNLHPPPPRGLPLVARPHLLLLVHLQAQVRTSSLCCRAASHHPQQPTSHPHPTMPTTSQAPLPPFTFSPQLHSLHLNQPYARPHTKPPNKNAETHSRRPSTRFGTCFRLWCCRTMRRTVGRRHCRVRFLLGVRRRALRAG